MKKEGDDGFVQPWIKIRLDHGFMIVLCSKSDVDFWRVGKEGA